MIFISLVFSSFLFSSFVPARTQEIDRCSACLREVKDLQVEISHLRNEIDRLESLMIEREVQGVGGDRSYIGDLSGPQELDDGEGMRGGEREGRRLITNSVDLSVMRGIAASIKSKVPSWTTTGDPCGGTWKGVICDNKVQVSYISLSETILGKITYIFVVSLPIVLKKGSLSGVDINVFAGLSTLGGLYGVSLDSCGLTGITFLYICSMKKS
jgi:hypothetical protein